MSEARTGRLVSLDAYRGLIMLTLAAAGFGLNPVARNMINAEYSINPLDEVRYSDSIQSKVWEAVEFQTDHPPWVSNRYFVGVSYWDLIQPSFMFMVGVAMPFSYSKRLTRGEGYFGMTFHALIRSIILILLGVFLTSASRPRTDWEFVNVLTQIGLGYMFVYFIMGFPSWVQVIVGLLVLVGYWVWFIQTPVPGAATFFDHFQKNQNAAAYFDRDWLLNKFPRAQPFVENSGGYATLNFIPSAVTMLFGLIAGEMLNSDLQPREKFLRLFFSGILCMALGLTAGLTVCPIVKRIWTPSWVLFSGAYVLWILAAFYAVFDLMGWRRLAFPLAVLGVNSILLYIMGQLMRPWVASQLKIHFDVPYQQARNWLASHANLNLAPTLFSGPAGPIVQACSVMAVFWLICFWLYRQRVFIRV